MKRFVEGPIVGNRHSCLSALTTRKPVRVTTPIGDLGFDGLEPAETGRPGFHSSILKLHLFCLNRVQSSRRLEREAGTYARLVSNLILRTLGLLTIAPDVSAKLALTTIASLTVLGALQEVRKVRPLWRSHSIIQNYWLSAHRQVAPEGSCKNEDFQFRRSDSRAIRGAHRSCRGQPRHFFFDISEQIFGGVKSNSHWRKIKECY